MAIINNLKIDNKDLMQSSFCFFFTKTINALYVSCWISWIGDVIIYEWRGMHLNKFCIFNLKFSQKVLLLPSPFVIPLFWESNKSTKNFTTDCPTIDQQKATFITKKLHVQLIALKAMVLWIRTTRERNRKLMFMFIYS